MRRRFFPARRREHTVPGRRQTAGQWSTRVSDRSAPGAKAGPNCTVMLTFQLNVPLGLERSG